MGTRFRLQGCPGVVFADLAGALGHILRDHDADRDGTITVHAFSDLDPIASIKYKLRNRILTVYVEDAAEVCI